MKFLSLFLANALLSPAFAAEAGDDFIRFKDGDTLHGDYQGLDEGSLVRWQNDEALETITFKSDNLRKISLNGGQAPQAIRSAGLLALSNGDLVPGELIAMGEDSLSLQTEFAGLLTIPREHVRWVQPNRHGGHVRYAGPFNEEGWQTPGPPPQETPEGPDAARWHHGGAAWYSNNEDILRLNVPLPDRVSIRFHLAWQPPLNANIALFTDFQRPAREEQARVRRVPDAARAIEEQDVAEEVGDAEEAVEEEPAGPAMEDIMEVGPGNSDSDSYGSGYLLSLLSSYSRLQRLSFDARGNAKKTTFNSGNRLDLNDYQQAHFELRAHRSEGVLALYINGEFHSEWQDLAEPLDEADRFFAISAGSRGRLRLSDLVIADWNGMPDSARSMENEERDILLLTNGTDRLSGRVLTMEEEVFRIDTRYGVLQIPSAEVADLRLATGHLAEAPESENEQVLISMQPKGLLSLSPGKGSADILRGSHPILGNLTLDLSYAYLMEFDPIGSIFDNWDDEF
ncbi:hypothetical protein [Roseibacillus ishigakijimensis]|uniref:Uncharacterized protein n=1 Tax=Roseibacillus ishigakijimensis TaxID=454146 RepID=A0A934RNI9_9BACT|nr:hypothetical protein [Roseibacillus ishigakijimensis]MBK1835072.1 hypothetical protein [Roseibacillus ishigakijimensis]